jgi:hypothetical protein
MSTVDPHARPEAALACTSLATIVVLLLVGACSATSTAQQTAGAGASDPATTIASDHAAPGQASAFCAKLQPLVQPFVKPVLTRFRAADGTTDDLHAGEPHYVDCDFRPAGGQVDVSLHDDSDHRFDDAAKDGYAALPGFAAPARYTARAGEMRWVDLVRGSIACEARFTMDDAQINGDWKQAAGKICEAALALH